MRPQRASPLTHPQRRLLASAGAATALGAGVYAAHRHHRRQQQQQQLGECTAAGRSKHRWARLPCCAEPCLPPACSQRERPTAAPAASHHAHARKRQHTPCAAARHAHARQQHQRQHTPAHAPRAAAATPAACKRVRPRALALHMRSTLRSTRPHCRTRSSGASLKLPPSLVEAFAGAVGEVVQVAVLYPLDTIKVGGWWPGVRDARLQARGHLSPSLQAGLTPACAPHVHARPPAPAPAPPHTLTLPHTAPHHIHRCAARPTA